MKNTVVHVNLQKCGNDFWLDIWVISYKLGGAKYNFEGDKLNSHGFGMVLLILFGGFVTMIFLKLSQQLGIEGKPIFFRNLFYVE